MTDPVRSKTEVLDFWAHLIYTTCLLVGRLSGLAFYARIADRHRKLTWAIRITAITMIALYIPQMALIIFHCIPVTAYWPYTFEANYADYTCIQWGLVYVTNSVISLLCDLALFTIPAFIIKKLKVATTDKIKLAGIMMPGLIVIAISSARMYLVIVGQWNVSLSSRPQPLQSPRLTPLPRPTNLGHTTPCSQSKSPRSAPRSSPSPSQLSSPSSAKSSPSSTAPSSPPAAPATTTPPAEQGSRRTCAWRAWRPRRTGSCRRRSGSGIVITLCGMRGLGAGSRGMGG